MTIVTHDPAGYAARTQTVTVPDDIARGLSRATWHRAKGITAEQRATFARVVAGLDVEAPALVDALVAAAAASSTRWGQSMVRRSGRAPVVECYAWLRGTHPDALLVLTNIDPLHAEHYSKTGATARRLLSDAEAKAAAQAQRIADLTAERDAEHQRALAAEQRSNEGWQTAAVLQSQRNTLPAGVEADVATLRFLLDQIDPSLAQRASDFRTGFRAGRS